jgi:quercetin dioxygenase-like cupin family protein
MSQADLQIYLSNQLSDQAELPRTTTLFREEGLRTLLLHLKAGEQIPEHQTRGAITVQCLKGDGAFFVLNERIAPRAGLLISVPPGASHSVAAREDTLLLVTLSEPKAATAFAP